jgi:hypothetical protein
LRKFLLESIFCLSGLTACAGETSDDKPSPPATTTGTGSNSVEGELKAAVDRLHLNAQDIVFQPVSEVVTFTVGNCEERLQSHLMVQSTI